MAPRTVVLLALALSLAAGCSVPDQQRPDILGPSGAVPQRSAASEPAIPASSAVAVYFVKAESLAPVARPDGVSSLDTTITELLAGPTAQELAAGLTSAIPEGTKLDSAKVVGRTAFLGFSDQLASITGREQLLAFAQIVVTSDSLPGIDRVEISVGGQPVNPPEPNGTLAQGPVTKADYAVLLRP